MKGYKSLLWASLCIVPPYILTDYVFSLYPDISANSAAFWGFLGTAITIGFVLAFQKKQRRYIHEEIKNNGKLLTIISIATTIGSIFWFYGLKNTTSGIVSFIDKSDIIFAFLFGTLFLKEKTSKGEFLGMIVAIIGFVFLSQIQGEVNTPTILILLAANVLYSLQSFLVKKYAKNLHASSFAFVRTALLSTFLGIFGVVSGSLDFIPLEAFILLVIGQIFGVFLYRMFYFEAHKELNISKIASFLLVKPVIILIVSASFLGEALSTNKLIGGTLIIAGLLFLLHEKMKLKKAARREKMTTT